MHGIKNILFVCTMNELRSPTAENIVRECTTYNVRSCGTDKWARKPVTEEWLDWADIIFVMEREHKKTIRKEFDESTWKHRIVCLDIPDRFEFMDSELVIILENKLRNWINFNLGNGPA